MRNRLKIEKKSLSAKVYTGLLLLFILFFPSISHSNKRETITWLKHDFPPVYILNGENKNHGIVDGMIEIYKKNLPEFDHVFVYGNSARIQEIIKKGQKALYASSLKTSKRKKYSVFSIATSITYPNTIILKPYNNRISQGEELSLESLISNNKLTGGFTDKRAYGGQIDNLLERYQNNKNILFRSGDNSLEGLLKMLGEKRIDYTIGYPWELEYNIRLKQNKKKFLIKNISELRGSRWNKVYIAAPKTDWGIKMIKRLNNILIKARIDEEYYFCQSRWYPEHMQEELKKAYERIILSKKED